MPLLKVLCGDVLPAKGSSHFPIPAPPEHSIATYTNHKGFYSIILLATVDNTSIFGSPLELLSPREKRGFGGGAD